MSFEDSNSFEARDDNAEYQMVLGSLRARFREAVVTQQRSQGIRMFRNEGRESVNGEPFARFRLADRNEAEEDLYKTMGSTIPSVDIALPVASLDPTQPELRDDQDYFVIYARHDDEELPIVVTAENADEIFATEDSMFPHLLVMAMTGRVIPMSITDSWDTDE